jgi:hypothetical protein
MINTSGIINTIAGNGTAGYSGDGGQATAAELALPNAVVLDAAGNLYIDDFTNNVIRKVNTSGVISTFAGNHTGGYFGDGGAATAAEINGPNDIAIDAFGNIFIADRFNNRVREVGPYALGINEVSSTDKVSVYPQPSNGIFNLVVNNATEIKNTVEVYNMLGEKVYASGINAVVSRVDLSNNAPGIYLYRVFTETGNLVSTGKLILQK